MTTINTILSLYVWRGFDRYGRQRKGCSWAYSTYLLSVRLQRIGIVMVRVRWSWRMLYQPMWWYRWATIIRGRRLLTLLQVGTVCRHLAAVITAGVPVHRGLAMVAHSVPPAQAALRDMLEQVTAGCGLTAAFMATKRWWPPVVSVALASSEGNAVIVTVLEQLADALLVRDKYAKKMWQALSVPLVTLAAGISLFMAIAIVILPQLYSVMGLEATMLPVVAVWGQRVADHGLMVGAALCVISAAWLVLVRRSVQIGIWSDAILYRVPIIGSLYRVQHGLVLVRMLPVLLGAGVPLPRALQLIAPLSKNSYWCHHIRGVSDELAAGQSVSVAWQRLPARLVPPLVGQSIAAAHDIASLIALCQHSGSVLDQQFHHDSAVRLALLQPLLLIGIGAAILWLLSALLEPLLAMMSSVGY